MINRDDAIEVLRNLTESDILSEEIEEKLEQIILCIEEEQDGRHIWGATSDDWTELHIAYRSDLWTDDLAMKMENICQKYSFVPAPYETGDCIVEAEDADV